MRTVWNTLRHYITPTHENVYRPQLLEKGWLVFFLAFTLLVEGFLIASIAVRQTDVAFFTLAPSAHPALSIGSQEVQLFIREFVRVMGDPHVVNLLLGGVGGAFLALVIIAFVIHIEIQSHQTLAGGLIVAAVALACLAANIHFLSGISQLASVAAP